MRKLNLLVVIFICFYFSAYAQTRREDSTSVKDIDFVFNAYEKNYDSIYYQLISRNKLKKQKQKYTSDRSRAYTAASDVPDSVIAKRLRAISSVIPMRYNAYVRSYIEMYVKRYRNTVNLMLSLSEYYFPIFEQYLDKAGVPDELKYLPIIESALNSNAVSRAGASGLWQFMHETGKLYNLRINSLVDERRDPVKSSIAAANYLRDLNLIYNDWTLALAAYNCGPGNVNKAIRRSGGKTNYWQIYEYLPKETRGYVPAYTAAVYIMNYYKEHGIYPTDIISPELTDTVMVSRNVHFEQIAALINISVEDLRTFNPQYKKDIIPGESILYPLRLPFPLINEYIGKEDSIVAYRTEQYFFVPGSLDNLTQQSSKQKQLHKVRAGETWAGIATHYGVSTSNLKKWNRIKSKKPPVGKYLIVYVENPLGENATVQNTSQPDEVNTNKPSSSPATDKKQATEKAPQTTYVVKKGDTLSSIASRNKMSLKQLLALNNMTLKSKIVPGQKLVIQ